MTIAKCKNCGRTIYADRQTGLWYHLVPVSDDKYYCNITVSTKFAAEREKVVE